MRSSNTAFLVIFMLVFGYIIWKQVIEPATGMVVRPGSEVKNIDQKGPSVYDLKMKLKRADSAIFRFENKVCDYSEEKASRDKVKREITRINDKIWGLGLPDPNDESLASFEYDFYRAWCHETRSRLSKVGEITWCYHKVKVDADCMVVTPRPGISPR